MIMFRDLDIPIKNRFPTTPTGKLKKRKRNGIFEKYVQKI